MFKVKNFGNIILSDTGFELHLGTQGRDSLIYFEGERKLSINSESFVKNNKAGVSIWVSSMRHWDRPFENESIDAEKCTQIIENIEKALKFVKITELAIIESP